jgi:hypothetical protein
LLEWRRHKIIYGVRTMQNPQNLADVKCAFDAKIQN